MTITELREYIDSLVSHITFTFNGRDCGAAPITKNKRYDMWYGDKFHIAKTVDEVMNIKFFDGKSLREIIADIED